MSAPEILEHIAQSKNLVRIVFGETVESLCAASSIALELKQKEVPFILEPSNYQWMKTLVEQKHVENLFLVGAVELYPLLNDSENLVAAKIDEFDSFQSKSVPFGLRSGIIAERVFQLLTKSFGEISEISKKLLVIGVSGHPNRANLEEEHPQLLSACNQVKTFKGLILPGRRTLPLHLSLALSVDPVILGVTGDEGHAIDLLLRSKIPTMDGQEPRTASALSFEETKNLYSHIVMEYMTRYEEESPPDLIGTIVEFQDEEMDELIDAREFHRTLFAAMNAQRIDLALALCFGDRGSRAITAQNLLEEYRSQLLEKFPEVMNLTRKQSAKFIIDLREAVSWHHAKTFMAIIARENLLPGTDEVVVLFKGKEGLVIVAIHFPLGVQTVFPWESFWDKISSPHIFDVEVDSHNIYLEIPSRMLDEYLEKITREIKRS